MQLKIYVNVHFPFPYLGLDWAPHKHSGQPSSPWKLKKEQEEI